MWYRMERLIWDKVLEIQNNMFQENIQTLLENRPKEGLILSGDCGWGHRRNSNYGSYSIFDLHTKKVVYEAYRFRERKFHFNKSHHDVIIPGNHKSSSQAMEAMGFFECIEFLKKNNALQYVTHFCTDRDCSVISEFEKNPDLKHIKLVYDPGHVMKGCKKDLEKIFGKGKRYAPFPAKIAKWFLVCVKKAEELHKGNVPEMIKEYEHRMFSAIAHYTCEVCKPICPCRDKLLIRKPPHELLQDEPSLFSIIPLELQQYIFFLLLIVLKY